MIRFLRGKAEPEIKVVLTPAQFDYLEDIASVHAGGVSERRARTIHSNVVDDIRVMESLKERGCTSALRLKIAKRVLAALDKAGIR